MGDRHFTTAAYAAAHNLSERTVRNRCAAGDIPGAYRLDGDRGPWRIAPGNDIAPHHQQVARGVSAESPSRPVSDLMSGQRHHLTRHAEQAIQVSQQLALVTTRPARAAAVMVPALAAIASRHYPGRDGWCVACSWQSPCPDQQAAQAALDAAALIVVDGAA